MGTIKTQWMNTQDLQKRWGCTGNTVARRMTAIGAKGVTYGRRRYFRPEDVAQVEEMLGLSILLADSTDDQETIGPGTAA